MIRICKVWIRAAQLAESLARFTRIVFCLTKSEDYPYVFRGSATSLRWQGHHLTFLCKHQVNGFEPEEVVFPLASDGKVLVSGSTFVQMIPSEENAGEEFVDLCAMHFKPEDYHNMNVDRAFFDLNEADNWKGDRESTFLVYGYPTDLRNLECAEPSYALSDIKGGCPAFC